MQEYIVYAILIFVPVGALMEYLLRREGLALKYRVIIVVSAWAIIISLPILVGYMGVLLALLVYLASIVALSWYFISVSQGPAWYLWLAGSSNSDEVYVSERLIDNTRVRTLGDIEDDMWFQENRDNLLMDAGKEPLLNTEALPAESSVSGDMKDMENPEQVEQNQIDEFSGEETIIDMIDEQPDHVKTLEVLEGSEKSIANIEDIAEDDELSATMNAEFLYTEDKSDQNGVIKNAEAYAATDPHEENENVILPDIIDNQTSKIETITVINQDTILANEEEIGIIENTEANSKEELSEDIGAEEAVGLEDNSEQLVAGNDLIKSASSATEMVDLTLTELIASADRFESIEDISSTEAEESGSNTLHEENHLDLLIEKGFALKQDQRYIEAIRFFKEATELTMDEELKYLLIMEIVNLYIEIGMYAQAEQVLFLSIGKAYTRTDIINKIDRQLSYIRILSVELDRLGLANTPISEVPRMVKMSVAEIMEV